MTGIILTILFLWESYHYFATSYETNFFEGMNKDIIDNQQYVYFYFMERSDNIAIFSQQVLTGDWGRSFLTHLPVLGMIGPAVLNTIISFGLSALVTTGVTYALIKYLSKNHNLDTLNIFGGNWLLYVLVFFLPEFITQYINLTNDSSLWIFDPYTAESVYNSPSFWTQIALLSILGIAKTLHTASQLPQIHNTPMREQLEYPMYDDESAFREVEYQPGSSVLIALRTSLITLFEINLIIQPMMNFPGMGRMFMRAVIYDDFPVAMALFFYTMILVIFLRLLLDLVLHFQKYNEKDLYATGEYRSANHSSIPHKLGKIAMSIFVIVLVLTWGIQRLLPPDFVRVGVLWNPQVVVFTEPLLPPFSKNHLLGTDYYGDDIFSQWFFGTAALLIPVLISIIIRPGMIYLIRTLARYKAHLPYFVFDVMEALPKLPILLMFVLIWRPGQPDPDILIPILFSLLFFGSMGKRSLIDNDHRSTGVGDYFYRWYGLASIALVSIVIELTLISFYDRILDTWGTVLSNLLNLYPYRQFFEMLLICFPALFFIIGSYLYIDTLDK